MRIKLGTVGLNYIVCKRATKIYSKIRNSRVIQPYKIQGKKFKCIKKFAHIMSRNFLLLAKIDMNLQYILEK